MFRAAPAGLRLNDGSPEKCPSLFVRVWEWLSFTGGCLQTLPWDMKQTCGALVRNQLFFDVQQASHSTRPRPQRAECRLPAGLSSEEPSFLSQHNFVFMSACASAAFANVALGHKQGLTVLLHDLHPPGP